MCWWTGVSAVGIPASGHHLVVTLLYRARQRTETAGRQNPLRANPLAGGVAGSLRATPTVSYGALRTRRFEHLPPRHTSRKLHGGLRIAAAIVEMGLLAGALVVGAIALAL